MKELTLPFPNVEFQALLTEIAAAKPDCVYTFFAGGGAVKFVKDYAAAGLNKTIPLYGAGFLTDGTLEAQGDSAQGLLTTLHYGDGLQRRARTRRSAPPTPRPTRCKPDVYAVQGYDAAQLLGIGLAAVKGDFSEDKPTSTRRWARRRSTARAARSRSGTNHNPVQDIYLRKVEGKENKSIGVAVKALADPGSRLHDGSIRRAPVRHELR